MLVLQFVIPMRRNWRQYKPKRPTLSSGELRRKAWEPRGRGIRPAAIGINLSIGTDEVKQYISDGRPPELNRP